MSTDGSLNCVPHTWFRCSFFWASANQCLFSVLDFISSILFLAVICSVCGRLSQFCSFNLGVSPSTLSKSFFFVNSACVCNLSTTRFSLAKCLVKSQPLAQSMILYTRLSCNVILIKLLTCRVGITFLIHILILEFSGRDLLQVTETYAGNVLHIISSFDFLPLSKS